MLVHLRLTVPSDLSDRVVRVLCDHDCATNVVRHPGVVLDPEGDLVEADVTREEVGPVLHSLEELGLKERGGIVLLDPSGAPFDRAAELERAAPGHPDDAVIWESVVETAEDGSAPTINHHVFLVLAVALAAAAVITDSAILVVGSMVVGPDFAVVAALSAGVVLGRWELVRRSGQLLLGSFVFAVVVVTLVCLLGRATGFLDVEELVRPRPNTAFIWHPDRWSFVVALIAGAAGALALSIEKTATMVGVFISVTTVPAAGNLALGLAFWEDGEILGSLAQLGANLAGMVLAGVLVLGFQRLCWTRLQRATDVLFGRARYAQEEDRPGAGATPR